MKRIALMLLMAFIGQAAIGQAYGEIQGKLSDENNEPIIFANVWVEQGSKMTTAMTDENGKFKIKPLNSGSYTLNATAMGYRQLIMTDISVNPDQITFLNDLELEIAPISGTGDKTPEIKVFKTKLIDPEQTSLKTLDMDDFKDSPAQRNITQIVAVIAPEAKSVGTDGTELSFKGSRPGANVVFLDGVKIMDGTMPRVPASGMKRISVYTGGVPAKYGDATGGVVVIETKDYFSEYNKKKYAKK